MTKQVEAHGAQGGTFISLEMGTARGPATIVELSISCRNLVDMDVFSKSDPMCVLFIKDFSGANWKEFDRTEIIWNNLNPNFVKKFVIEYSFEESQKLKFDLYDIDSKTAPLSKQDFLGSLECTLGEIVTAIRLQKPLNGPKRKSGTIIVSAEELSSCKEQVTMQFRGKHLDKKDVFGKSDPFLLFSRTNEDGIFTVVHKTEVIKVTLNPTWKPFTIPVRALCNGDYERSIKVECYDWDKNGGHDFIGEFYTTMREMCRGPCKDNVHECINPKKQTKKGKKYKNSGIIELLYVEINNAYSFFRLHSRRECTTQKSQIRILNTQGTEIEATISVDFTSSNGDPRDASSLHYMNPSRPNMYARALRAVVEIIEDYDTDKLFPALGFGAKVPPDGRVSHEFFLNSQQSDPYCKGVEGVLEAYYRTLSTVQLYGPTNFAPCINHVARIAEEKQDGSTYFILLILTDGVITDMPQTCQAIVTASSLPLSIIIVGIGEADFDAMNILDGDDVRLSSRGKYAERDIVQFVSFRDFIGGQYGDDLIRSQAALAKEVLAEIPDQFLSFMSKNNIKPGSPPKRQSIVPPAATRF